MLKQLLPRTGGLPSLGTYAFRSVAWTDLRLSAMYLRSPHFPCTKSRAQFVLPRTFDSTRRWTLGLLIALPEDCLYDTEFAYEVFSHLHALALTERVLASAGSTDPTEICGHVQILDLLYITVHPLLVSVAGLVASGEGHMDTTWYTMTVCMCTYVLFYVAIVEDDFQPTQSMLGLLADRLQAPSNLLYAWRNGMGLQALIWVLDTACIASDALIGTKFATMKTRKDAVWFGKQLNIAAAALRSESGDALKLSLIHI